jgi:hypothetical protein
MLCDFKKSLRQKDIKSKTLISRRKELVIVKKIIEIK